MNTPAESAAIPLGRPADSALAIPSSSASVLPSTSTREGAGESIREIGGRRDGTEPTRFGDWEKGGRCIDF